MLTVLCFYWRGGRYTAEHVNVLRRMVARNLSLDHIFMCVGDDPDGLDEGIEWRRISNPKLIGLGNAYPKLEVFRRDAAEVFGERIVMIDLDTVVVGRLDGLFDREDDAVVWRDPLAGRNQGARHNTSLLLLRAGALPKVWESFRPRISPRLITEEGWLGSDQAWLSRCGPEIANWTPADGVLSWRHDVERNGLPEGARIVFFHGAAKPWDLLGRTWIAERYR